MCGVDGVTENERGASELSGGGGGSPVAGGGRWDL